MKLFNLKALERDLPMEPPLQRSPQQGCFCQRCGADFFLDIRVFNTLRYRLAKRLGADFIACPLCDSHDVRLSPWTLLH